MTVKRSKVRTPHEPPPQAEPLPILVAVDPSNPALAAILADIAAGRSHTRVWGELRRKVFPGPTGWKVLQRWCAEHSITCNLNYGSSSRTTEVQFLRLRAAAT